jgi:hypothetical protein
VSAEQEEVHPFWQRGYEAGLAKREAELQAAQEREIKALVAFYHYDRRACAFYCDEVADPSGALLGRVRDAAQPTEETPASWAGPVPPEDVERASEYVKQRGWVEAPDG